MGKRFWNWPAEGSTVGIGYTARSGKGGPLAIKAAGVNLAYYDRLFSQARSFRAENTAFLMAISNKAPFSEIMDKAKRHEWIYQMVYSGELGRECIQTESWFHRFMVDVNDYILKIFGKLSPF